MISLSLLDSNKFVQVKFTYKGISTYLIHRVELSYTDIKKYNSVIISNYLERLDKVQKSKIKVSIITDMVETYMSTSYDIDKAKLLIDSFGVRLLTIEYDTISYEQLMEEIVDFQYSFNEDPEFDFAIGSMLIASNYYCDEAVYIINDLTKITEKMFNDFVETKDFRTMRQHIMYKITTESELVWWAWYKFFEAQGYKKTSWKFLKRASELIQSKWNKIKII